ncbi:hypothetical protein MOSE0_K03928 [Monosporozyma servazzii]
METESSDPRPIRLAVLGGESTGKTAFISRLTLNIVHDVHYPTKNQTNWLFDFIPQSTLAKAILDGQAHERLLNRTPGSEKLVPIFESPVITPYVLLSPLTFQAFTDNYTNLKNTPKSRASSNHSLKKTNSNNFYSYSNNSSSSQITLPGKRRTQSANAFKIESANLPRNYIPPTYSPIPIDIIDTPGFKPEMVVPFLEVSLFRNLDKSILKGLANQPRTPVSTTSLLVASGASELNGKIDGYILVYSAIPELNHHIVPEPPSYGSVDISKNDKESTTSTTSEIPKGGGLSLLTIIRSCILDAWTEFRNYETDWKNGQEEDVYSLAHSLKSIWKSQESEQTKLAKVNKLRTFKTDLDTITLDPASPNSPPPCIIVCTHINSNMASPLLIQKGKQLATQWESSFVGIDNIDDINVDVALSLIIKDIVEKDHLLSKHHGHQEGHGSPHKHNQNRNRSGGGSPNSSPKTSVLKRFF